MFLDRRLALKTNKSYLLLGPRRVGKSTFLRHAFPKAEVIDLLKTDLYFEYRSHPELLRERYTSTNLLIVIDEAQRIPDLLHEVHWLLENSENTFVLSGSSARRLRREGVSNLAGRLSSARLFPLTYSEIPDFNLQRCLQYGCLPPILLSEDPKHDLKDYCGEYLKEEIQNEGLVRRIDSFSRFLELSALSNAQAVSYASLARDCGVATKTAREYFQILEDTLIGFFLNPWTKSKKRRAILAQKFYFFDCGIPNSLLGRQISRKTPEFGQSFEQFMILETLAAQHYDRKIDRMNYWRSASGYEVDLLIDESIAVEFKTGPISIQDTKGLQAIEEEISLKHKWIVGLETKPRKLENGVEVLPWQVFLERLGEL